jgi:hypothetical protein
MFVERVRLVITDVWIKLWHFLACMECWLFVSGSGVYCSLRCREGDIVS